MIYLILIGNMKLVIFILIKILSTLTVKLPVIYIELYPDFKEAIDDFFTLFPYSDLDIMDTITDIICIILIEN